MRTLKRALLKSAILSFTIGAVDIAALSIHLLQLIAPYLFGSAVLFNLFTDRFEKPTTSRLISFVPSDLFSEQEARGLSYTVDRLKARCSELYYLSWLMRIVLLSSGCSLIAFREKADAPLLLLVGFSAFGVSLVIGLAQWRLSRATQLFFQSVQPEIARREKRNRQLSELQQIVS